MAEGPRWVSPGNQGKAEEGQPHPRCPPAAGAEGQPRAGLADRAEGRAGEGGETVFKIMTGHTYIEKFFKKLNLLVFRTSKKSYD